jgi:Raf kinase inhibitor-like YbhB/YbcL family protein
MKRVGIAFLVAVMLLAGWVFYTMRTQHTDDSIKLKASNMQIMSTAFGNNEAIPQKYSCQGEGVNPPLEIKDVPGGAKAMAVVVDDPDAPSGTFVHWVAWNFGPTVAQVAENSVPEGVTQGSNGAGKAVWYPLCPPSGTHHYHFKLYALDEKLSLQEGATKSELVDAMKGHIVAQTELVGTYEKH